MQECNVCGELCSAVDLRLHRLAHFSGKKYLCRVCYKGFSKKSRLRMHRMKHGGTQNETCSICGLQFMHKRSLFKHLQQHQDDQDQPWDHQDEVDSKDLEAATNSKDLASDHGLYVPSSASSDYQSFTDGRPAKVCESLFCGDFKVVEPIFETSVCFGCSQKFTAVGLGFHYMFPMGENE